ncbi:MAG: class II histone deacetylase [Thermomicrobiales bacterium]
MAVTSGQSIGLVFDDRYLFHNPGLYLILDRDPYPFATPVAHYSSADQAGRAKHLMDLAGVTALMTRIEPYEASDEALMTWHTARYLAQLADLARTGGDTGEGAPMGVGGDRIARLAAGGVMAAVDAVATGQVNKAYALIRPPGHHAVADHGMGYCVFNNVVIAARHAQQHHGLSKVAIVDWDVHHGNGTQDAFYADDSVLFVSLHQDNLFPTGSGKVTDTGAGKGEGFTINVPLPSGTGNAGYLEAFRRVVVPSLRAFEPDLIVISAGQDPNVMDPLGRMTVTTQGFRDMAAAVIAVADEVCDGRLIVSQEGGYAPEYAPYCSAAIAETLTGPGDAFLPIGEPYGDRSYTLPSNISPGRDAVDAIDAAAKQASQRWPVGP